MSKLCDPNVEFGMCSSGNLIIYSFKKGDARWIDCGKKAVRFWKIGLFEASSEITAYCEDHDLDSYMIAQEGALELTEEEFIVLTVMRM